LLGQRVAVERVAGECPGTHHQTLLVGDGQADLPTEFVRLAGLAFADGLPHVPIHGLRRSFALIGEASGAPAGAIAQVMGHRPCAISERYKPRPIPVLGEYLAKVEAFILAKAGIEFDAQAAKAKGLRLVTAA
jgi:integrase